MLLNLIFAAVAAFAQPSALEEMVAWDIEMLMHDTVNEGAQYALVALEDGEPVSSCVATPDFDKPYLERAQCVVEFVVTYEGSKEEYRKDCELSYTYDPENIQSTLRGDEDKEILCMENLSEAP